MSLKPKLMFNWILAPKTIFFIPLSMSAPLWRRKNQSEEPIFRSTSCRRLRRLESRILRGLWDFRLFIHVWKLHAWVHELRTQLKNNVPAICSAKEKAWRGENMSTSNLFSDLWIQAPPIWICKRASVVFFAN